MKKEVNAFNLTYAAITRKRQRVDPVNGQIVAAPDQSLELGKAQNVRQRPNGALSRRDFNRGAGRRMAGTSVLAQRPHGDQSHLRDDPIDVMA
ncbi:hypothetical protein [Paraburkholderia sp. SIMBA_054]|uniref:hypothetical protein n=1 Tax=Paraburkholderia sp. SIMBA_054 TaxID=3085795 RepID=UPI00397E42AD